MSVGSAVYVRRYRQEIEQKGRFMCNFDSCCSAVGWFYFVINADSGLTEHLTELYNGLDVYFQEVLVPDPCNDLFPFTVAGVPGITHMRKNCNTGRFYHHQAINSMDMVSMDVAGKLVYAACTLLEKLDAQDEPQAYGLNPATKDQVADIWKNEYGGWDD